jgi:large subunit ribosomal protein L28e
LYATFVFQQLFNLFYRTYKSIANQTAKSGYRPDLRAAAIARASALRRSQRPVKPTPERKPRGKAAKKAAEKA